FHRRLVVRDDDELNAVRHLLDDLRKTADVRIVERRVDLVEQTERRRIQLEDRKYQRNRGQRLLTAREQMNRARLLAGRARHDRDTGGQQVLAVELEIGVSAAEQAREKAPQTLVRLLVSVLELRTRLTIDLADGFLEGLERLGEIVKLRVEVGLALGLLLELVDCGQVDRAAPLN